MKNLSLIAAIGENRELGYNNDLIWHIKEDMKFYREMTWGKNIIMGRKTLESLPKVALRGRFPIVLTSQTIENTELIQYYKDLKSLLQLVARSEEEFMVIGGSSVYQQFLPYVDTMYLTSISDSVERVADCYFPEFYLNDWNIELLKEGVSNTATYKINKYIRKK